MRTTISVPDHLFAEAKRLAGQTSFSDFAAEAIRYRVRQIESEQLARAMEEGYRMEADSPSIDEEWETIEAEGL